MARKSKSKRLSQTQVEHDKFLRSHGIDPQRKPILRGVEPTRYERPPDPTSDMIPANGPVGRAHTPSGGRIIGQVYNKGPLMVLSHKSELANAKRRDK